MELRPCEHEAQLASAERALYHLEVVDSDLCLPVGVASVYCGLAAIVVSVLGASQAIAAPGDVDPSFSEDGLVRLGLPDARESASAVEPLSDGKILVAGTRRRGGYVNETYRAGVVMRLNEDGTVDDSYGSGGEAVIEADPGWRSPT